MTGLKSATVWENKICFLQGGTVKNVPPCFFCRKGERTLEDCYKTVEKPAQDEFTQRRSRFIGYCHPVQTQQQAQQFIQQIKSLHWDATHNVYAYILRSGEQRYSDDGEPQGTAGVPCLEVLRKSGLVDAAVVVTRYFGGVLLGAGGLVRAYSHGAKLAIEASGIVDMRLCALCTVRCSYDQYGRIASLIPQCGGAVEDTSFTDDVCIKFHVAQDGLPFFEKQLSEVTSGQIRTETTGKAYLPVKNR